jgi:hypothetical protein
MSRTACLAGDVRQANRRCPTPRARRAAEAAGIRIILAWESTMIRKLASGQYRLYSRKIDSKTGRRRNLGTFDTRAQAEQHEREVQYFKRHG